MKKLLFFLLTLFIFYTFFACEKNEEGNTFLKIKSVSEQDSLVFNVKYEIANDELEMNGFYFYVYQTTTLNRLVCKQIIDSRKGIAAITVYYPDLTFNTESTDEYFNLQLCRLNYDDKKEVLDEEKYCLEGVFVTIE
jgi:hypothetical protein